MRETNLSFRIKPEATVSKKRPATPQAPAVLPAHGKTELHFSGRSPKNQPPSLASVLRAAFVATLLGASMHGAAGSSKTGGPQNPNGKGLTPHNPHGPEPQQPNWVPHTPAKVTPAFPEHSQPPQRGPHHEVTPPNTGGSNPNGPNGPDQPEPPNEPDPPHGPRNYKQGDMLEDPFEAILLAKAGQIAHEPDALKVVTGPGNEKLFYELKLKTGVTVGLSVPHDDIQHDNFLRTLKGEHIIPKPVPPGQSVLWNTGVSIMEQVAPLLLLAAISHLARKMSSSGLPGPGGPDNNTGTRPFSNIRRSETKKEEAEKPVTFADVRGYPEVIRELKRVKERYLLGNLQRGNSKIKVKPIKGLLLEGPPGTGKSMMAKALAHESNVPFFYASGSQFVEMYVGVGAARVRQLFASAKAAADRTGGAIIFIDELDAVGGKRNEDSHRGGNSEHTQTLNELLQQMSGFSDDPRIMVLAATNRKDHLDDALQRSGRFDKSIKVDLPHDKEQRLDILDKYLAEHPTARKLDRDVMAEFTSGKSGADLANLVNQMAEVAVDRISEARHNPDKKHLLDDPEFQKLQTIDFLDALRNMEMGMKRETRGTHEERKTVAVHEVLGHGLVARAAKTPLHIVSMQPRGDALGHVITDPRVASRKLPTLESMLKDLVISMGGRASEREMLGAEKITPGASGDIASSKAKIRQMLATRMLSQASGADIDSYSALNEQDRKLADKLLKEAEHTAEKVLQTVPREKLWNLVDKAMNLKDELEGEDANAFYDEVIDTVGQDKLYEPIQQFIQKMADPTRPKKK